jgi:hypothetical protein
LWKWEDVQRYILKITGYCVIALILILLYPTDFIPADVIQLKSGALIRGRIDKETSDRVVMEVTKGGTVTIDKSDVESIQRGETPSLLEEYLKRLSGIPQGDANAHYELGLFCLDRGLYAYAAIELNTARRLDSSLESKVNEHLPLIEQARLFESAMWHYKHGNYKEALRFLHSLLNKFPESKYASQAHETLQVIKSLQKDREAVPKISEPPSQVGRWCEVFICPETQKNTELINQMVKFIDDAASGVDAAVGVLDLSAVFDALLRAKMRGVDVRLVTNSKTVTTQADYLAMVGVPVVEGGRRSRIADSFFVVDKEYVWVNFFDLIEQDVWLAGIGAVKMHSSRMAANFEVEFEEMFTHRKFGIGSTANTPFPQLMIDGDRVETCFLPEDDAFGKILAVIREARSSITFCVSEFNDQKIANAMISKFASGVPVTGIVALENNSIYSCVARLRQAGIPVKTLRRLSPVHRTEPEFSWQSRPYHNFIIVDERITILGTYTLDRAFRNRYDGVMLIIEDEQIARKYRDLWRLRNYS